VERTVADLNIAHFTKLLETEADPVKRETLQRLLAGEEAKLARAIAEASSSAPYADPARRASGSG